MADKSDIDYTYTTLDKIFRMSIGENADFSAAMYNGDFSMTLEQAQRAKHDFIAEHLHIKEGSNILEMGSGWGPFMKYARDVKKAKVLGLTLSDGQYEATKKHGFDVRIKDCRTVTPNDYGTFDAIVSVGAFEHFCSLEEYEAGKQDEVYRNFFKTTADLIPVGGRFFLQTMTFTHNMFPPSKMDINADKDSDEYLLALSAKHLPGSWLPYELEQIVKNASPYFKLIVSSNGRADYIETIKQWRKMVRRFSFKKYALFGSILFQLLFKKEFRHLLDVGRISPLMVCFQRDLMNHYRIVFEKI